MLSKLLCEKSHSYLGSSIPPIKRIIKSAKSSSYPIAIFVRVSKAFVYLDNLKIVQSYGI